MAALQTVQKIGPVLDLFTVARPEWGVSEVAAAVGVPRSSAHALLASLVDIGLLQCRARGTLSDRLAGGGIESDSPGHRRCEELCRTDTPVALREKYGETSHPAVMERYRVMYVDKVLGNHVITVTGARIGAHLDAHCSAVGKVLLAHCSPAEVERQLATQPLRRLTPATRSPIRQCSVAN